MIKKVKKKPVQEVQLYTKLEPARYSTNMYERYQKAENLIAFPKDATVTEIVLAMRADHMERAERTGERYTQEAKAQVVRSQAQKERYKKIDKLDAAIALLGGA